MIADLDEVAAVTPSPVLHVHLRYARTILSGDAIASQLYADLKSQDLTRWPWAWARAEMTAALASQPSMPGHHRLPSVAP